MADQNTTALARLEQSANQAITAPAQLASKIREWQSMAHVLTPAVQVSAIAPQHAVNVAVVVLDPEVDDNGSGCDCYQDKSFMKPHERGVSKIGLRKICAAAGISWDGDKTRRTDDGRTSNYWSYYAFGKYIAFDGQEQTLDGSAEVDLRDGSPQIGGWTPEAWRALVARNKGLPKQEQEWSIGGWSEKRVLQARRFGLALAETKAKNRAIRDLGLKQKYSVQDLQKPFVVLRTTPVLDMSDPIVRQMVTARALGGASALYPHTTRALPDPDVIDAQAVVDAEPNTQTQTQAPTNVNGNGTRASEATRQEPAAPTGPLVIDVRSESGVTRDKVENGQVVSKGGRAFVRFFITLDDRRILHTFDKGTGEQAERFMKEKIPVEVETQPSKYTVAGPDGSRIALVDILELKRAEPRLDFEGDDNTPTDADLKL